MYFSKFSKFAYDFELNGQRKVFIVSDITSNVRFRKEILGNIALYDEYDLVDGETPEIVAEKVYGNSEYHWIIMLVNERYDYIADYPLSYNALISYVDDQYGEGNANDIHHYINSDGFVVNSDFPGATSVSNLQHEERINESKRRIKIVSPNLISVVLKQFSDII
jgi:hypothetical protein